MSVQLPIVTRQLVLSLFSGVGLLDRAFREAGFVVVSAGDLIFGQDIRNFVGLKNKFDGVIGGSPCQGFSDANRDRPGVFDTSNYSYQMLLEFQRIIIECEPSWYLFENVRNSPNLSINGYHNQRIDINQAWFDDVTRLRHIQFGDKLGRKLHWDRANRKIGLAGCALASDHRSFKELCNLQGLEDDFDLPDFTVKGKKKAIGNGVPLSMGRVIANSVKKVTELQQYQTDLFGNCDRPGVKLCLCGCGRIVTLQRAKYYDASCRKRAQRKRDYLFDNKK